MNPETRFLNSIRDRLPSTWMWTRIESSTENGIPDVVVGTPHGDVWIEAKMPDLLIRPWQVAWWFKARSAKRTVLLMWPTANKKSSNTWVMKVSNPFLDYFKAFKDAGKTGMKTLTPYGLSMARLVPNKELFEYIDAARYIDIAF